MNRTLATAAILCFCLPIHAQEPLPPAPTPNLPVPPDPGWQRVQRLPQDATVVILERGRAGTTPCSFDHADDTTLTCISYGSSRRIVFPRRAIDTLWTERQVQGTSWGPFVAIGGIIGIFTIIGATQDGGRGAGTGALIGTLISGGVGAALISHEQPPPHLQRRIVYRAP